MEDSPNSDKKSLSPLPGLVIHLQVPQHLRASVCAKTAPTLSRPIRCAQGKLCWATLFRLLRLASGQALPGLVLSSSKVCSIPSGPVVGLKNPQMKIK